MNAFESLLQLSPAEKKARGVEFTPVEIAQQPSTWAKAAQIVSGRRAEIGAFLKDSGVTGKRDATLILTGAGSSEFVGNAVYNVLRQRLGADVMSIPTTHIVINPQTVFLPGRKYVVLSFARSGNSPESMATFNLVKQVCPSARQMAITCNKNGKLALACKADPRALYIELPEETNDQSLVMTSSYSTMAFMALALCFLDDTDDLVKMAAQVGAAGSRIIKQYGDVLQTFAQKDFSRACFLGSNALYGTMQECHLKMQEMTEGRVAAMFNSFVGLRHGPQVFASHHCAVVAAVGTDPYVLKYELDMLREIKAKKQGVATLVICAKATPELRELSTDLVELFPEGNAVHDDFRVMTDVMVGQILGTFKSIHVGLKPDNPSVSGTINRVVQGVTIYPYPKGALESMAQTIAPAAGGAAALQAMVGDQKRGRAVGVYSICSANRYVLEAAMLQARADGACVLIESTSNQVNQFGGYIGMTAAQFAAFVRQIAASVDFPPARIILGGDHLGPNAWQKEPAGHAMPKAVELVRSCVLAGYVKIHLDASMRCADDPGTPAPGVGDAKHAPLSDLTVTERAADLAAAAEEAYGQLRRNNPGMNPGAPVYVIGTEVPVPGGEQADHASVAVTKTADLERTIELSRQAFVKRGLQKAWERVIAVVVQPGVEFGDATVIEYNRAKARELSAKVRAIPGVVFEAHSTDYQTPAALRQLVEDQFAILKVGPWLTYAFRETVFALSAIEEEWLGGRAGYTPSGLRAAMDGVMLENPGSWKPYYHGDERELRLARTYSFSDRIRYYWPHPKAQAALAKLLANLSVAPLPLTLLDQFLPVQYEAVRAGQITSTPRDLILHKVQQVTGIYARACGQC